LSPIRPCSLATAVNTAANSAVTLEDLFKNNPREWKKKLDPEMS